MRGVAVTPPVNLLAGLQAYINLNQPTGDVEPDSTSNLGSLIPNFLGETPAQIAGPGTNLAKLYGQPAIDIATPSNNVTETAIPDGVRLFPLTYNFWMLAPAGNDTEGGGYIPWGCNENTTWGPVFSTYHYNGTIYINVKDDTGNIWYHSYPNSFTDGSWHMFTITVDIGGVFLYVDGVNYPLTDDGGGFGGTASALFTLDSISTGSALYLGALNEGDVGRPRMAMFGVWNRTLSEIEIAALYNGGSGLQYSEL